MNNKQLPKGTWSKSIRYFYSMKNRTRFWCESLLERDALLQLEFDDGIEAYKAQPMSFTYKNINEKESRYTPDQLVKMKSDKSFIFREVKVGSRVDELVREKVEWISQHIHRVYGSRLEIITDDQIRVGSSINNFNIIYPYKRICVERVKIHEVEKSLPYAFSFLELKEVSGYLKCRDSIPFALLAHGILKFDYSMPLNDQSIIYKA